jgi:hypothetical protein
MGGVPRKAYLTLVWHPGGELDRAHSSLWVPDDETNDDPNGPGPGSTFRLIDIGDRVEIISKTQGSMVWGDNVGKRGDATQAFSYGPRKDGTVLPVISVVD